MKFDERLEDIKATPKHTCTYGDEEPERDAWIYQVSDYDFEWLISQLESLHKQNRTLNKKNHRLWKVNQELTADRDELRRRYESNRQTYINVQKGHASKRRKKRG